MKEYTYEDIKIGMEEQFSSVVTKTMQENFRKLSGDTNPLHTDAKYAKTAGFKDKVVYGLLHTSLYSQLIGNYLPGKYCLLQKLEVKFRKPVYIGDKLKITGMVKEKQDNFSCLLIKGKIINEKQEIVSTANIMVKVMN